MARGGSDGKTLGYLAVLAVLLAVLGALVYARWPELKERFAEPPQRAAAPAAPKRAPAPSAPVAPTGAPAAARAEPAAPARPEAAAASDGEARRLMGEGQGLLAAGDFVSARNSLSRASALKCSASVAELVAALMAKAMAFDDLTARVAKNPEATGKLSVFKLSGGNTFEGVIVGETATEYTVRRNSGITAPIRKDQVDKVETMSPDEQRSRLVARLAGLEQETKPTAGIEFYQLAEFAWANNLTKQAVELLEKAYSADPKLGQSVIDDKAGKLLSKAIWRDAANSITWVRTFCNQIIKDYPTSRHVASAKELLAHAEDRERKEKAGTYKATVTITGGKEPEHASRVEQKIAANPIQRANDANVKVDIDSTKGSAGVADILQRADKLFNKGMEEYQQGRPGMPDFNRHLGEAVKLFDQAMSEYEAAAAREPNNRQIDSRMTDCQRFGYHARKMQTLGGF